MTIRNVCKIYVEFQVENTAFNFGHLSYLCERVSSVYTASQPV